MNTMTCQTRQKYREMASMLMQELQLAMVFSSDFDIHDFGRDRNESDSGSVFPQSRSWWHAGGKQAFSAHRTPVFNALNGLFNNSIAKIATDEVEIPASLSMASKTGQHEHSPMIVC